MKDTKQAADTSSPTGITPRSVNLVTRISNYVVGLAEDPELRGPVFLDCLIRSHADCFGVAKVSEEQLAAEAGVTARCIRKWLKVAEERFGYKVVRHPWTKERGRQPNEYWMDAPTAWSQVPTAMLRLPNVPYQSKLLLCAMARVSADKSGSRMPMTLAKLTGYSKSKDVWKWIQPVRGLVELWRQGDSKKLFWSLPGGLDMTMDRVLSPGEGPTITWSGLQDQAPLVPLDPPKDGTASSSTEDPLDKPLKEEDASCDASQTSQQQQEGDPLPTAWGLDRFKKPVVDVVPKKTTETPRDRLLRRAQELMEKHGAVAEGDRARDRWQASPEPVEPGGGVGRAASGGRGAAGTSSGSHRPADPEGGAGKVRIALGAGNGDRDLRGDPDGLGGGDAAGDGEA